MQGVGLGFRKEISGEILSLENKEIAFLELAPENWMGVGGRNKRLLLRALDKYPITSHGLSLSIGSPEPLDWQFMKELKVFLSECSIKLYSEHLSYCKSGNAHLYDLLPLPFTEEALVHVISRIKQIQDFLEMPIAIENISYYCQVVPEIGEAEFLSRIVKESGCQLLLDVNNVYVNAFNHQYDPYVFLQSIPLDKVSYIHIAGHEKVSDDLIIDTHGKPIIDPVFELFEWTVKRIQPVPVLLERDQNLDDFPEILTEITALNAITNLHWTKEHVPC